MYAHTDTFRNGNRTSESELRAVSYRCWFSVRLSHGPWHTCYLLPVPAADKSWPKGWLAKSVDWCDSRSKASSWSEYLSRFSRIHVNLRQLRTRSPRARICLPTYRPMWCSSFWPSSPVRLPSAAWDSAYGSVSRPDNPGRGCGDHVGVGCPPSCPKIKTQILGSLFLAAICIYSIYIPTWPISRLTWPR